MATPRIREVDVNLPRSLVNPLLSDWSLPGHYKAECPATRGQASASEPPVRLSLLQEVGVNASVLERCCGLSGSLYLVSSIWR